MKNKLPVEPVKDQEKDFFRNRRGAKVYHDVDRLSLIHIFSALFTKSHELEAQIKERLGAIGYGL